MPDKLPEEFAPTGPKLSRFPIQPAPPIRPRLFADEAGFAMRLAAICGATEFVAWAWLAANGRSWWLLALAALRLLKPWWAWAGTRVPRTFLAYGVLFASLLGVSLPIVFIDKLPFAVAIVAAGLPALADLCATTAADALTVERRPAAYAWLDMAQALGALCGLVAFPVSAAVDNPFWGLMFLLVAELIAFVLAFSCLTALRDRDTPRSAWPLATYGQVLKSPMAAQLAVLALAGGLTSGGSQPRWALIALPIAGMAISARLESRLPNAIWLPRIAVLLGLAGLLVPPLRSLGLGVMLAAIPAAVARGAGEMERPIVSSLAWTALFAGAAIGAVL